MECCVVCLFEVRGRPKAVIQVDTNNAVQLVKVVCILLMEG